MLVSFVLANPTVTKEVSGDEEYIMATARPSTMFTVLAQCTTAPTGTDGI